QPEIAEQSPQHHRDAEQRSRDRPMDERGGDAHGVVLGVPPVVCAPVVRVCPVVCGALPLVGEPPAPGAASDVGVPPRLPWPLPLPRAPLRPERSPAAGNWPAASALDTSTFVPSASRANPVVPTCSLASRPRAITASRSFCWRTATCRTVTVLS